MLTLIAGDNALVVAPEHGGSVIGWRRGRVPVMRRALPEAVMGDPHAMACFPLVPYCNRIREARFAWMGRDHQLSRNFGDRPHSIHGIGWQRPWRVESVSASAAVLSLTHSPDPSWPFAFQAEMTYRLMADGLEVGISITNTHDQPTPAGIGLHPYFPREHDPALRFAAPGVWMNDSDVLPSAHLPVPSEWQHHWPVPASQTRLDNCFTGWNGVADILAGEASLHLTASKGLGNLQVFTPHWADFFCVEPVSHVPDAINRPGLPPEQVMDTLAPGEILGGSVYFRNV